MPRTLRVAATIALLCAASLWLSPWYGGHRLDPLLALPIRLVVALLAGGALWRGMDSGGARERLIAALAVGSGLVLADLLIQAFFAARLAPIQSMLGGGLTAGALMVAERWIAPLSRWRWPVALVAAAMAFAAGIGALWISETADPARPGKAPRVLLTSSLPLSAFAQGAPAAVLAGTATDTPILAALKRYARVREGQPSFAALRDSDVWLAAHPGALPPAAMVDADAWLRAGGRAVILVDAYSSWPPPYPLGDPRNPPITSLLTPLLTHWGITMTLPPAGLNDTRETRFVDRQRLVLRSVGRLSTRPAKDVRCAPVATGFRAGSADQTAQRSDILRCAIGRGRALIVADADLLDPDVWQGQPDWLRQAANADWLLTEVAGAVPALAGDWRSPVWRAQ